jgi:hypothetical protein
MRAVITLRPADRLALLVSVTLVSTGCAAHGAAFAQTTPPVAKQDEAVLYVFRAHAEPTAWGTTVSIDGQELTTLNQGGFTVAVVKPGARKLKSTWPLLASQKDGTLDLEVAAGRTYYVAVTGVSRLTGSGMDSYGQHYYEFTKGTGMHSVNPQAAPDLLAKCCVLQPSEPKTY